MGASSIIPKEQLSAYQRWEMRSFDDVVPSKDPEVVLPTVEQIERIHQQAREEGHAAGYREGKDQVQTETQRLQMLVQNLEQELQHFDQRVARDLLTLSLDVAKQMLCQALRVRPEIVLTVVQDAIACLPHFNQHAHLVLHPEDAALVRSRLGEQLSHSGWKILEDAQIARGGCRVETANSQIDATLPSRWQRVLAAIGQEGEWLE
jgi:flagellar assembly protein FliH